MLILNNIRSIYNTGSIFRSADAFAIDKLILTGITPYPKIANDPRPPYVQEKVTKALEKTALGALNNVPYEYCQDINQIVNVLKSNQFAIYALEQSSKAIPLKEFSPTYPCALIVGNEKTGISKEILEKANQIIEIPMHGHKESLNVAVAAGIILYKLKENS